MPLRVSPRTPKVGDIYKDEEELYYWIVEKREKTGELYLSLIHFPGEMDIENIVGMKYVGNIISSELVELLNG